MRILRVCLGCIVLLIFVWAPVRAQTNNAQEALSELRLDEQTVTRGYTASVFDGVFKLGVQEGILHAPNIIRFKKNPKFEFDLPEGKELISDIIEFDILNKDTFFDSRPLLIELSFDKKTTDYKKVYFWDSTMDKWRKLPGLSNNAEQFVRATIHLPFARLAVLADTGIMEEGRASWYSYRNCDCAASPDYERGTKLRVTNIHNQKNVIVTVNDYGPDRKIYPDRVIDLDKVAFLKLSSSQVGIIDVKVEPIQENSGMHAVSITRKNFDNDPFGGKITAKAAALINAKTGELLWAKNYNSSVPIASLTKLMSAQIFLDTNTPWDKVVKYKKYDDEAGSRLYIYPDESMTTKDLFYAMLVSSANNAVNTLVRSTALGQEQFVDLMNKRAQAWGLKNTKFFEPTGLDPRNTSTAYEMAILAKEVLRNFAVLQATTVSSYSFHTINTNQKHTLKNTNPLVGDTTLYLTGGKTGYLDEAGYCLMTRAKDDNSKEVIAVILGAKSSADRKDQMRLLLKWGLEKLKK